MIMSPDDILFFEFFFSSNVSGSVWRLIFLCFAWCAEFPVLEIMYYVVAASVLLFGILVRCIEIIIVLVFILQNGVIRGMSV